MARWLRSRVQQYAGSIADARLFRRGPGGGRGSGVPSGERPRRPGRAPLRFGSDRLTSTPRCRLLELLRRAQAHRRWSSPAASRYTVSRLPAVVDDTTLPRPTLSYGADKAYRGDLVADVSRANRRIDGIALRLPGIVARPADPRESCSAFMSDISGNWPAGEPFICPVSPGPPPGGCPATRCVDNLLHAAAPYSGNSAISAIDCFARLAPLDSRTREALARMFGEDRRDLLFSYEPDEALEAGFGPISAAATDRGGTGV